MAERRSFLLRLDPGTFAALQAWAADDLRSVNGQVEFLLRRALREAGRDPAGKAARRVAGSRSPGAGDPGPRGARAPRPGADG
ncbi:MAG: hypothetical protein MUE82_00475 [Chloroflexi bacterium]|jgi:hypothetical protein|nr:hypothetical protein [Chloroflexota bacterium]